MDLGPFSIEVTEAGCRSMIMDYGSFELAERRGRCISADNRIVSIIQWDATKRRVRREWLLHNGCPPIAYSPSTTLH